MAHKKIQKSTVQYTVDYFSFETPMSMSYITGYSQKALVQFMLVFFLVLSSVTTVLLPSLPHTQHPLQTSKERQSILQSECDEYTFNHTKNRHIRCKQSILAHSGVDYLSKILPNTDEIDGYASVRILDSYTFTSSKNMNGNSNCRFAKKSDGRHFPPLDLLQLRVIAEGVLSTIGSNSEDGESSKSRHESGLNVNGGFLISKEHTEHLTSTKELGDDLHSLFRSAFKNRYPYIYMKYTLT